MIFALLFCLPKRVKKLQPAKCKQRYISALNFIPLLKLWLSYHNLSSWVSKRKSVRSNYHRLISFVGFVKIIRIRFFKRKKAILYIGIGLKCCDDGVHTGYRTIPVFLLTKWPHSSSRRVYPTSVSLFSLFAEFFLPRRLLGHWTRTWFTVSTTCMHRHLLHTV